MSEARHFDVVADVYQRLSRDVPYDYRLLLMRYLGLLRRDARLLELGCGVGEVAILLASAGVQVVGLDASVEMIRAAQRVRGAGRVTWVNQTVEEFDLGTDRFDAVFSYESFHLFPDPFELVRRIGKAIVPGGRFGIGWRIASWEDEFKDHIVSTFDGFGVSLADWEYSTCHHFHEWIGAAGVFGPTRRVAASVPSCDSVDDAATLLASIERTSHLSEADRRRLRDRLRRGFAARAVDGYLMGTTTYGIKYAIRRASPRREISR